MKMRSFKTQYIGGVQALKHRQFGGDKIQGGKKEAETSDSENEDREGQILISIESVQDFIVMRRQ